MQKGSVTLPSIIDMLESISWLVIQCAGIVLVASLSFFLTRSIQRKFLNYWTVAWFCLAAALLALIVAPRFGQQKPFVIVYALGEYIFGLLFVAGCHNYVTGAELTRRHFYRLIPFAVVAIVMLYLPVSNLTKFTVHSLILSSLFVAALYFLRAARRRGPATPGLRVMTVALLLLALDLLHYAALFSYANIVGMESWLSYLKYASIYDLILEILLGFGTVMVVMEDIRREVEEANRKLISTRDRLEKLARLDPLTEALNRHAFYSLIEKRPVPAVSEVSGCAVVVDIDNLKPINDSYGHTVGDAAIREVCHSIRSVIRADDLLFRWGGDEFLILFFNISEVEARNRIHEMETALDNSQLPGLPDSLPLVVSYGIACYNAIGQIEEAIDRADSAMYAKKQARKTRGSQKAI